ncbi:MULTISPECIES: phosphate regulon sensor histidine kinase PhoR [Methylotenera]|uniref:phosphate regulon sensor histidine kinase PhoR n=1 Tax=Methylotenera TaxID=359407 RepID=UPI0003657FB0|nr:MULTISPECIES: phosphate regulon sensor histidine kinase PhoR [Methylotenera]
MQDIRWNAFWLGLILSVVCLITWAAVDATIALIVFSAGLLIYLISHLYWLHRLHIWLQKPVLSHMPNGTGIWEDIFASLYQEHRKNSRSQTQLSSTLERFRHAASALPDGVVVLNSDNEIEWCNPPAENQLGLNLRHDQNQPISYLVRHSDFVDYLQAHEQGESNASQINPIKLEPIKLKSWRNPEITLEIQLIPFGSKQKLLICRDVTALEKTDIMRRDFIANVSHELRTPLTVVGGFLETIADMDGAVPASLKNYFGMMMDQTSRMRRIIEDLLTLSTIESNVQSPDDSEIDMPKLLNQIQNDANNLSKSLSKARHHVHLDMDKNLHIKGAQEELYSALSNLTSNAIRYTPAGGDIFIGWKLRDDLAVFSVRDTGIGIEQQHIDRLTERFYRVDRSRSRETGGTGLGLAIVKHILSRHHARLEIESEAGVGSTFSIVFPKACVVIKQVESIA